MNIKKISQDQWEIKTKKAKIVFNNEININDFTVPGNGEFEVSSVQVEVLNGIYIFYVEDMVITLIGKSKRDFTKDELKKVGQCDLLFLSVSGQGTMDTKKAIDIISETEPYIIIPIHYDNLDEFKKSEGLDVKETAELKITKADLREDQREVYILS